MTGYIDPTKEAFAAFRAADRPGPIHMLNLVRLRERAAYPDGREATGAEAYSAYGRDSGPVFIAQYPSVEAFVAMIRDPVYREAVKHRQAAVEDSRLIRLTPGGAGVGFG